MSNVFEALSGRPPMAADLAAGVNALSANQTVTFTQYVRLVLPLDGYVFWVRASLVSPSALYDSSLWDSFEFNEPPTYMITAPTCVAEGSLHYSNDVRQDEAETYTVNRVVFTSLQEVNDLNAIGPNTLFIAEVEGVKYAFSSRGYFYEQSKLWHYVGDAVYADMQTQIVDDVQFLDTQNVIVSNSLPLWLAFSNYVPSFPSYGFSCPVRMYPSFLSPLNIAPPYGTVHVSDTDGLASTPYVAMDSSQGQLVRDRVRVTLWGTRNFSALEFLSCVYQRSRDYDEFGMMNVPVVRDEKRTQRELATLAQKKTIEFEVSYYQGVARNVARQLIKQSIPTYLPQRFAA